jgi:predicted nucleic acid-binding protein
MPVVSNTSPVLNLALIDRLGLLCDRFGEIWVPPAVLKELRLEEDLAGSRGGASSTGSGMASG